MAEEALPNKKNKGVEYVPDLVLPNLLNEATTNSAIEDSVPAFSETSDQKRDLSNMSRNKSDSLNLETYAYETLEKYPITPLGVDVPLPTQLPGSPSSLKPTNGEKKILVYYTPSMKIVAERLRDLGKRYVELGDISWSHFKDEFPNLLIKDALKIRFYHVAFLASLSTPTVLFEQYAVMASIPKHLAKSVTVFIPYFAVGTMERVTKYGEIATADTLSRMLSAIPNCARGPCQIVIFDVHALQTQFYFSDNILIRLETAIPLIHDAIWLKYKSLDKVGIAFPDEGAYKRFHQMFNEAEFGKVEIIVCEKRRKGNKCVVTIKDGNPKGLHVVIVDDLVQTGGTLVECAKACKARKATTVSCYCTHGVFPRCSWKRFVPGGEDEGLFDTFWITNSIPPVARCVGNYKPFKILDLAPLYWNVLKERM